MFTFAKILEAAGLGMIAIGFLKNFPRLLDIRTFTIGAMVFLVGWIIELLFKK